MFDCIVCAAFGDHKGPHYTAKEVSRRLFSQRVRSLGKGAWVPLPHCTTLAERPVMVSAHMPDDPHAHMVDGVWLAEAPEKDEEPASVPEAVPEAAPEPELEAAPEPALAMVEEAQPVVEREAEAAGEQYVAPVEERRAEAPEAIFVSERGEHDMAEGGTRGYLAWARTGLEVTLQAVNGDGAGPSVEDLKAALQGLALNNGVKVRLTETLGDEEAWVSITTTPKHQAALLMCAGQVVDMLTGVGVYDEVLLASD